MKIIPIFLSFGVRTGLFPAVLHNLGCTRLLLSHINILLAFQFHSLTSIHRLCLSRAQGSSRLQLEVVRTSKGCSQVSCHSARPKPHRSSLITKTLAAGFCLRLKFRRRSSQTYLPHVAAPFQEDEQICVNPARRSCRYQQPIHGVTDHHAFAAFAYIYKPKLYILVDAVGHHIRLGPLTTYSVSLAADATGCRSKTSPRGSCWLSPLWSG